MSAANGHQAIERLMDELTVNRIENMFLGRDRPEEQTSTRARSGREQTQGSGSHRTYGAAASQTRQLERSHSRRGHHQYISAPGNELLTSLSRGGPPQTTQNGTSRTFTSVSGTTNRVFPLGEIRPRESRGNQSGRRGHRHLSP